MENIELLANVIILQARAYIFAAMQSRNLTKEVMDNEQRTKHKSEIIR